MSENGAAAKNENQQAPQVKMNILGQFVRDLSFENVMAQKGSTRVEVKPDVSVQVNLDAKKRPVDNQYEIIIKLNVDSKATESRDQLFLLEVEYAGVFFVEGVPEEQLHAFLLIECPRMLFPFLRRIVSDVTRDGGFPPLNLENIDFVQIYRARACPPSESTSRATEQRLINGVPGTVRHGGHRASDRPASRQMHCARCVHSRSGAAAKVPGAGRGARIQPILRRCLLVGWTDQNQAAGRRSAPDTLQPGFPSPAERRAGSPVKNCRY